MQHRAAGGVGQVARQLQTQCGLRSTARAPRLPRLRHGEGGMVPSGFYATDEQRGGLPGSRELLSAIAPGRRDDRLQSFL
jgi:hypothetical protein